MEKIESCDIRDSSSNSINGCFYCCCYSCCCFKTMPLCHSFSQGLNGSWPLTFHVPLQRWCLVDSQWKSRTNKGKVGRASVFLHGTGQGCDWHWLFDPPDPARQNNILPNVEQRGRAGSDKPEPVDPLWMPWRCEIHTPELLLPPPHPDL